MGAACTDCRSYQQQLNTLVFISKQNFVPIKSNLDMFEQIKAISEHQIPQDFKDHQFYIKNSTYFIGSLEQSIQPTFGILYKPGETLFYGNFFNGQMNQKGVLRLLRENLVFRGEFVGGKPLGNGELEDSKKTFKFNGFWKQSSKPVSGVLKLYQNKTIQQIQFINFQHGNVQIEYRNGSIFKGFIDKTTFLPHGSGKMQYSSGDSYEGQWVNGKFQGMGTYQWKSGQRYNGEYFKGLRNGQGEFYYLNAKYFTGIWKDGKKQGFGKILTSNGYLIQKGIFHNDVYDKVQSDLFVKNEIQRAPRQDLRSELMDMQQEDEQNIKKQKSDS